MRRLATAAFRVVIWVWLALGLTCVLAEALFSASDGPSSNAVPVVRLLFTPFGRSGQ